MFCIFCGEAAHGTVSLRCGSCGRAHYLNSKISSSALVVVGGDYLVAKRAVEPELGKWDLPGGFCEYGEDPAGTARRETLEETGAQVTIDRLLGAWMDEYVESDGRPWPTVALVYAAHLDDPSAAPAMAGRAASDEISQLRWMPLASPPSEMAFPLQQRGALAAFGQDSTFREDTSDPPG